MATNLPIDAFISYVLDVKPYHTKILEIIEQYRFYDNINITIPDVATWIETWANIPLCQPVGFGLDFDDNSGFDSLSNCDLFQCVGSYGVLYDNSDVLLDITIPDGNINATLASVELPGDFRYDTYFQIASISGNNVIKILGNVISTFSPNYVFVIIPKNKYQITEKTYTAFYVNGNVANQFNENKEFSVLESGTDDNVYAVISATYLPTEARTIIQTNATNLDATSLGFILINSGTKNNAVYIRTTLSYDGTYTSITLHPDTPLSAPLETKYGVVVLRTALKAPRRIWIFGNDQARNNGEWKIINSSYDLGENITTLFLEGSLDTTSLGGNLELIGYFFGAGFDGFSECGPPTPNNVHVGMSEYLVMELVSSSGGGG